MDRSVFINREKDLDYLGKVFTEQRSRSRFVLVSAKSGWGKSALVAKAVTDIHDENFIRIKTQNHEKARNESGYFVREIGRSINRFSESLGAPDPAEQNSKWTSLVAEGVSALFTDYLRSKAGSSTAAFVEDLINQSGHNSGGFLFSGYGELESAIHKYIRHFIGKTGCHIIIENIQNIDIGSLEFLKDIISDSHNGIVVGEYTLDGGGAISAEHLLNYLGGGQTDTFLRELESLSTSHIVDYLYGDKEKIERFVNECYNGNLYVLSRVLGTETSFNQNDTVFRSLDNLDEHDKLTVAVVSAHGGCVSGDLAVSLFKESAYLRQVMPEFFDLPSTIGRLSNLGILREENGDFAVGHDSVLPHIGESDRYQRHIVAANTEWLSFYLKRRDEDTSDFLLPEAEVYGWELFFRAQLGETNGLTGVLEKIYRLCLTSSAPGRTIRYAETLQTTLSKSSRSSAHIIRAVDLCLAKIFYRLAFFDHVVQYTADHLDDTEAFLLHTTALTLSGNPQKAHTILDADRTQTAPGSERTLGAALVRIATLRASNEYDACAQLWWDLYRAKSFEGTSLHALFLRTADMALIGEGERRNDFLKTAISEFHNQNDGVQESITRIALSQHLGYDGDIEGALEQLRTAQDISAALMPNHYILENNFGVISLYEKNADGKCRERLKTAFDLCGNYLDKLIILNNLLIWHFLNDDRAGVFTLRTSIEEILDQHQDLDYDLRRISYFNIGVASANDTDKAYYFDMARAFPVLADNEYWELKLNGTTPQGDDFRYSHPCYPIFLSSWHLDFDTVLVSSQSSSREGLGN